MEKVLITGAGGGIGNAICDIFVQQGYEVVGAYNSTLPANPLVTAVCADLSVDREVEMLAENFPHTDILINNAGTSLFAPFDSLSPEEYRKMYEVNLFAALNLTRKLLPNMIRRKKGCIINISSIWGRKGASCEVDYSTAKSGLIGFTKALAKEVGPSGIRVNCVCPGIIDTRMNSFLSIEETQELIDAIPLEALGRPEDVAEAVFFLASEKAAYITGAVLPVDGGM